MDTLKNPIIIIPSRLGSTRLPNKPLADINGKSMIVHCLNRAKEAGIGPVVVACAEEEIATIVRSAGGQAVLTNPKHISGSDRTFEALCNIDPEGIHDCVINLQGDLPTIDPSTIEAVLKPMSDNEVGIATVAARITNLADINNENVVKVVVGFGRKKKVGRALYFSRNSVPNGSGAKYHHIGIYAYRRDVLKEFVGLRPGIIEKQEKLEQLRALENGLRIDVALVDSVPIGVDTHDDLIFARKFMK